MAGAVQVRDAADARAFAERWVAAWNRLDVEEVLGHFAEGCRFTSPKAAQRVGLATVTGKDALGAYWSGSIELITSIHFALDRVLWDVTRAELVVLYDAEINGQRTRACEFMRFGPDGLVREGEAMYGAMLP